MAPKRQRGQLPAPIRELRDALAAQGKDITEDTIAALASGDDESKKVVKKAFSCMGTATKSHGIKPPRTDKERRQLLARFSLDPDTVMATESTAIAITTRNKMVEVWVTESQLAGPLFMNNAEHAKIMVQSMESRPFKGNEGMRAAGVKQYCHMMEETSVTDEIRAQCMVEGKAAVDPDDFREVSDKMRNSFSQDNDYSTTSFPEEPPKAKRSKKQVAIKKEPESPELDEKTRALNSAKDVYDKTVRAYKTVIDRINKELKDTLMIEEKLKAMEESWGPGPSKFLQKEKEAHQTRSDDFYKKFIVLSNWKCESEEGQVEAITAKVKEVNTLKHDLEEAHKLFVSQTISQFSKVR